MRNSVKYNGKLREYLINLMGGAQFNRGFNIKGHLKIIDESNKIIFDDNNLIVNEGKGLVMDWLAKEGFTETYVINPFSGIVLTKNTAAETINDTFANSVYGGTDYLSDEGVLHIPAWTSVDHVQGVLTILLSGTITQQYGNDPANNHINSVAVCAGMDAATGGPGEGAYAVTNNEKLFARVSVGDLVKTVDKSYNFQWFFQIT